MKVQNCSFSYAGKRGENQDRIFHCTASPTDFWAAIADGMGGEDGGATAANIAISALKNLVKEQKDIRFEDLYKDIRDQLTSYASSNLNCKRMGTTLSVLHLSDYVAYVGHVGDTRVYHLRGRGVVDRTFDQTEVQKLIDEKILTKSQAQKYRRKNVLLSVLSPVDNYDLYQNRFSVLNGDRFVLTSDGVYKEVLRQEIRDLSLACETLDDFCEALKTVTCSRAPKDDHSAICLEVGF